MTYLASHETRLKALENALVAITKAVIEAQDALADIAATTTDPSLRSKLEKNVFEMSSHLREAVDLIVGKVP